MGEGDFQFQSGGVAGDAFAVCVPAAKEIQSARTEGPE